LTPIDVDAAIDNVKQLLEKRKRSVTSFSVGTGVILLFIDLSQKGGECNFGYDLAV